MIRVYLVRHGETAWSLSGQHTGRTDIPLTAHGEAEARQLAARLEGITFEHVLSSPLQRARRTCELAGLGAAAQSDPDLAEWDYGTYEGRTTADIRRERPGWDLLRDGVPGGESAGQVSSRVDRCIARLRELHGNVAVFSHGHLGRVLAVRWIGLQVPHGRHLLLETSSIGILTHDADHDDAPVIELWNERLRP